MTPKHYIQTSIKRLLFRVPCKNKICQGARGINNVVVLSSPGFRQTTCYWWESPTVFSAPTLEVLKRQMDNSQSRWPTLNPVSVKVDRFSPQQSSCGVGRSWWQEKVSQLEYAHPGWSEDQHLGVGSVVLLGHLQLPTENVSAEDIMVSSKHWQQDPFARFRKGASRQLLRLLNALCRPAKVSNVSRR